jgi:hypothetical protein
MATMNEIFIICHACGTTHCEEGLDPDLLEKFKNSSGLLECKNCGKPLAKQEAFVGHWETAGDGSKQVIEH